MAEAIRSVARPPFVPLDEHQAIRIYRRNLPHWRQDGATYFVTFRLADSIPEAVRKSWEEEKRNWLKARGVSYDGEKGFWREELARLPAQLQFRFQQHFNRAVQACLDRGLGCGALRRQDCLQQVWTALFRGGGDRYHLGDFVIMPNHVHALLVPVAGSELEMVLKSIKGSSAVACNELLGRSGTFWQADSYDHIVRTLEQLVQYREYIASNPSKAGIEVATEALYRAAWMDAWLAQA
jgi:REP-associated tyrosine transposase